MKTDVLSNVFDDKTKQEIRVSSLTYWQLKRLISQEKFLIESTIKTWMILIRKDNK